MNDIDIARAARLKPLTEVAGRLDIPADALYPIGPTKAKLTRAFTDGLRPRPEAKTILVTAINPTPAGEGKTTTTIGLGDALNRLGKRTAICLREPSLGPCFGLKGGATGGGHAQVVPMEEINLHFTGDFHAISTANNLLAAMVDNHIHHGNELGIDSRRITWRRVLDMNDRALREVVCGLGGPSNGHLRQDGFDITVASEIMAIFCLATNLDDLSRRLGNVTVGLSRDGRAVTARDLQADGAMAVLMREAFMPNLVQTLENNPVFIHGGPFANIAHGCNSVIATRTAQGLADYVVTEAGFGADLGAEKFFDIKCRKAGITPNAAVVVATVRALKMHGGVDKAELATENLDALREGCANLKQHIENVKGYGVPVLVAINHFATDTVAEHRAVEAAAAEAGVEALVCRHWAEGGAGATALAERLVARLDEGDDDFSPLYQDHLGLVDKIETIATSIYRADGVELSDRARKELARLEAAGYGELPVCIAKTQYSFSADPALLGAPRGFTVPVRAVRHYAGAEFLVAACGDIMTMPGLPSRPAAEQIHLDADGEIVGLF